ncbi:unnamed protein product [Caenorhabditis auriculariae]|uniref:Uncharacterized protein n=1 Tax=Caenorhabditis auriculariae TaxID=2777116 RepID=A0A8S1GV61_9PELO|nr:unnamed protein product [Caenorhabditis auriculariae]
MAATTSATPSSSTWASFCGDGGLYSEPFSTGVPNLSICAQHTILVYAPTAFFLLTLPFLVAQCHLNSKRFPPLPYSGLLLIKVFLSLFISANSLFVWCFIVFGWKSYPTAYFIYPPMWTFTFAATAVIHFVRLRCGLVSSGVQHISALLFLICGAPELYQWIRAGNDDHKVLTSTLSIAYFCWYGALFVYCFALCFADPRRRGKGETAQSPELDSSFLNRLTLWWFNEIPWKGAKRDLEPEDVFDLNEGSKTKHLCDLWEQFWEPRRQEYVLQKSVWKRDKNDTKKVPLPSVVGTLFRMFRWEFLLATALKFTSDTLQFASPFLLNELIGFVSDSNAPFWKGFAYSILMFSSSELRSFLLNGYFYIMFRMGIKIQTAMTAAVYKKTLYLSNAARREKTVGEIVNLMAIDVERFQLITPQIQQFWSCPYQITFALVYLFFTLGYSAIPGVVIMLIFVPMNIISSMVVKKWQMQQMKLKDERTKMVNEILNGIKVVKLYAWEIPMEEYIERIREKELELIRKSSTVRNILDSFNTASPFMVALFSFGTFVLSDSSHKLTPQIAFVSLTLFNQLRSPMTMIALLINQTVQAVVSNKRLKEFLVADELDFGSIDRSENIERSPNAVRVEDFTASWDDDENRKPTLEDIDLLAPRNSLIAVVGKVGSGKSSLLSALLGEMGKLRGKIGVAGRVAYVPQQPWIQNMTVRDNIVFGRPFDKKRYDSVLFACALKPDLKILPEGDQTEIGEKGINLSGGQKARVSLARAVYQNLDVYLLDDPLSAVDAHVGRHIFEQVIGPNGLLRSKTRILVTHGLTYTKFADEIVVLEDGEIAETGTYSTLMRNRGAFFNFVEEYKSTGSDDSDAGSTENLEIIETSDFTQIDDIAMGISAEIDEMELANSPTNKSVPFTSQVSSLSVSAKSPLEGGPQTATKLIKKEDVAMGKVKMSVYKLYVKASTYLLSILFIVFFVLFMTFQCLRSFWLSAWSNENDPENPSPHPLSIAERLGVYGALGVTESACFFVSLVTLVYTGLRASRNLHAPLIHNLLRSPMSFYDTTPLGRILNRCAKDIEVIDMLLPLNFRYLVMCFLQVFFTLIVIVISTPLFAAVIVPLAFIYLMFLRFYVPTSRQLKRLESVHRSPIYSHFGETIQGAASIRAFNKVDEFRAHSGKIVDAFIRCKYANTVSNRWLAVRLEFVGNCIIFFAALFAVLSKEFGWSDNAGVVGVSISYALNITEVLNFAVRQVSEIEANIVAVERVNEYTVTPNEAEWKVEGSEPSPKWPESGVVQFVDYSTRYREGLDLVLNGISANVRAGEKIGIVGRTGAGKSSFALALFRMIEPAGGRIIIDNVDVSTIGLHDLRSNITIIPQDPVLFSGSLRFNLDPFSRYTDEMIWRALELAHLKTFAANLPGGLAYVISEAGENISVGQRQLVALARALLRHTKVLVLDEATAAVDVATDALIQATIREQFDKCTVFTIAHRLNTIMDYDRIMVLDKGQISEFDSPNVLLANKESAFAKMVADSNNESAEK